MPASGTRAAVAAAAAIVRETNAAEEETGAIVSASATVSTFTPDYRRPETTDARDFWHLRPEHWERMLRDARDPEKKRTALQQLRKFDMAGRIMETDEGEAAATPCQACVKHDVACRVWVAKPDLTCAYCRRTGRAGCDARGSRFETDADRRLAVLSDRVSRVEAEPHHTGSIEARFRKLEGELDALREVIENMDAQWREGMKRFQNDVLTRCNGIDKAIDDLRARMGLVTAMDDLRTRLDLEATVAELRAKIERVENSGRHE